MQNMKNCKAFLFAAAFAAVLSSCASNNSKEGVARIEGSFKAAPACGTVSVKVPGDTSVVEIDKIQLAADGSFGYDFKVTEGQPEFVYLYCGPTKVASLLLAKGDAVKVSCDTTGYWTVEGSQECSLVRDNELALSALLSKDIVTGTEFVAHYRAMLKYILSNSKSLTVYPVFNQRIGDLLVFGQYSDAVIMQQTADALEEAYPDSRYTKALRRQADERMQQYQIQQKLSEASVLGYPDMMLPDINEKNVKLSDVATDKTVIVFWSAREAANKLYNQDVLLPLYDKMKNKGLCIYAVNLGGTFQQWASCVMTQKLPWTNVYDNYGVTIGLYGVNTLPTVFVLNKGELKRMEDMSLNALLKALK